MSMMWTAIGVGVLGAGTTLYGINAQKKANQSATNANKEAQDEQNLLAWNNYLLTRGIQPKTPAAPGVVPGPGGYSAVNTRLPLWATMKMPATSNSAATSGNRVRLTGTARAPSIAGADGASTGIASSDRKALPGIVDPLNLMGSEPRTLGNLAKRALDPLGIF